MMTTKEILTTLRERKITQARIAEVLCIERPNVAALYRTKESPRKLSHDEALKLIEVFDLEGERNPLTPCAPVLEILLGALLRKALRTPESEHTIRVLASSLEYGLGLVARNPAIQENQDALALAADAAADRLPNTSR